MVTTHNLGFPRMGKKRELKFALEGYWKSDISHDNLLNISNDLRAENWAYQKQLDYTAVGDSSFYDHVLDTSLLLGNLPNRTKNPSDKPLDAYFRAARGRTVNDSYPTYASEMTKWFDTNYHYIVPEFYEKTEFKLFSDTLMAQIQQAKSLNINSKPVIIGPVTYLFLGKEKDSSNKINLLTKILPVYKQLIAELAQHNIEWLQIDEPALVMDLDDAWKQAFQTAYTYLAQDSVKILLATYFGGLRDNLDLCAKLPVNGIHIDAINAPDETTKLIDACDDTKIISVGVVNGRNIWKNNLTKTLDFLEPIYKKINNRLWIAPSCSLLHSPVDLKPETNMDAEIKSWLSFAIQKIDEIAVLKNGLLHGRNSISQELSDNKISTDSRSHSKNVHNETVTNAVKNIKGSDMVRHSPFERRIACQLDYLNLPLYPTTTIGSFPQTADIRKARKDLKSGVISQDSYKDIMKLHIKECIKSQEDLDIDVLVHGEAERNDMVEYFGEQLKGYIFSQSGWVQSYGSRMVKPPIIFGDISRPHAMTVEWTQYAQSLTDKHVKGMLTGPVTMLNWSFVRDDQPRSETCKQLALAIRDEVTDLAQAGINIIQIDEPAIREGLPLRNSDWAHYLDWAVMSFRLATSNVNDTIQIHTHMCYSEFNDIMPSISDMDADVITIETSRSDMELLDVFDSFKYSKDIGPGVYDIHSPNTPTIEAMVGLMNKASLKIDARRLWVNPDCGLKTRTWAEVVPALENMVLAAKILRKNHASHSHHKVA
jgi:5-methyltetrahydropteroyltriglutamate--homocysteine methyltransferase